MVLINGRPEDLIRADDRGLLYGDGLFETIRVVDGLPRLWDRHLARLNLGCVLLKIPFSVEADVLLGEARRLCGRCSGTLRLTITRGSGPRGYRYPDTVKAVRIMQFMPTVGGVEAIGQDGISLTVCATPLARQPVLAGIKHLNRLEQVIARSEWQDEFYEGLMLDTEGHLVEGTMSNVFIIKGQRLVTPPLDQCGVAGVLRSLVIERAEKAGLLAEISSISLDDLALADGAFITNSLSGVLPVRQFRGRNMAIPAAVRRLQLVIEGEW